MELSGLIGFGYDLSDPKMDLSVLKNFQDWNSSNNISRIICWIVLKLIVGIISAAYMEIWNFIKIEPGHDKTIKMSMCPAKTQISLGICPPWSESSLCTKWVTKDQSFLRVDSKDW